MQEGIQNNLHELVDLIEMAYQNQIIQKEQKSLKKR